MALARLAAAALLSGRMATGELPGHASVSLPSTAGAAVGMGLHPVSQASFAIKGYACPDEAQDGKNTKIFYPSDAECSSGEGCEVVLFSHGTHGYAEFAKGYDAWLQTVASHGFVVLAPLTKGVFANKSNCEPALDLVHALKASSGSTPPWAAVATVKAKFDRVGLMGHSAGARLLATAARDASDSGYFVAAAVLSHGGNHDPNKDALRLPAFFMEAQDDQTVPPEEIYELFDHVYPLDPHSGHVFVNLAKGGHTEPSDLGQLNAWTARFFSCHIIGSATDCGLLYGTQSGSLCRSVEHVRAPGTPDPTDGCNATGGVAAAGAGPQRRGGRGRALDELDLHI